MLKLHPKTAFEQRYFGPQVAFARKAHLHEQVMRVDKSALSSGIGRPSLLLSSAMSYIADEIGHAYPELATELFSLSEDQLSDSRLMAELASHIVDLFEAGHAEKVVPAFELTEHLIASGQETDKHVAIVGFLETVQNVASHRTCGISAFEQFLGMQSQTAWTELLETWKGKTSLAEVVAAETGAKLRPLWWQFWRKRDRRPPRELLSQVENPELRKIIEQITRK
jgi:hypothetical protein